MNINGWIILDKPTGITSAHAVAKVKRLLKPEKIGHAGTLDPLASGVLPLALGEATKTVPYMMDAGKAYGFTVSWGEERDTDDREGQVVATSLKRPSDKEIQAILPQFVGIIQQAPPAYSAIKIDGKRAYEMARAGEAPEMKVREVRVDSLVTSPSPVRGEGRGGGEPHAGHTALHPHPNPSPERGRESSTFLCHCGKGTYIRSLARDMGRQLGCFGHISQLRRLKVGKFNETHAISLEMLENMVHKDDLGFLQPVESVLDDILARDIDATQATHLRRGQPMIFTEPTPDGLVIAKYNHRLVAICDVSGQRAKSLRVFNI